MTTDDLIRVAEALVAGGACLVAAQDMAVVRHFADDGLLSWPQSNLDHHRQSQGVIGAVRDATFAYDMVRRLIAIRCALAAAILVWAAIAPVHWLPLAILAGLCSVSLLRSRYGGDGADQMYVVVLAGLSAATFLSPMTPWLNPGLLFVAAQITLAYSVSGVAKLSGRRWRDGSGLIGVLSTFNYGHDRAYRLLAARPMLSRAMSWGIMAFQLSFVLVWVLPQPWCWAYLGIGVLFHIAIAYLMGLGNFLPAFVATYPCIVAIRQAY